eukprot:UC1_evm1s1372
MGASGHLIMFHHNNWWSSSDGGHNFVRGDLPGAAGAFDYVRTKDSRTEPSGTCYAILAGTQEGMEDGSFDSAAAHRREKAALRSNRVYEPLGVDRPAGAMQYLMVSEDFGGNWTYTQAFPADFQAGTLAQDPTDPTGLWALTADCLRRSADKGK